MTKVNDIIGLLRAKSATVAPFGKKIKLVLDGNVILVDGTASPPAILEEDGDADITVTATLEDFAKIIDKKIKVQMALMSGKLKTRGDMLAAVPLIKLL